MASINIVPMGSALSYVAATADFDDSVADELENDGKTLLAVDIVSGVQRNVRFMAARDCDQKHGAEAGELINWTVLLGASPNTVMFGPFPRYRFNGGTGAIAIRTDVVVGTTYAGLRLSNVRPI